MARRDDALGVTGVETMIGAGVVMQGDLKSDGDIAVDGAFTGTVVSGGDVILGVNGSITGNITGRNVTVGGKLKGDIKTEGEATIQASGTVQGNITATSLAIESGASFQGQSIMKPAPRLQHDEDDFEATETE